MVKPQEFFHQEALKTKVDIYRLGDRLRKMELWCLRLIICRLSFDIANWQCLLRECEITTYGQPYPEHHQN